MTASTEDIRPLGEQDLPAALALSTAASWNQVAADWAWMLQAGQGWGVWRQPADGPPTLVASTLVLPYGRDFAWISMVLVLPSCRRQGLASRLLSHALQHLQSQGRCAVLDATADGQAVYQQRGFRGDWMLSRHRCEVLSVAPVASGQSSLTAQAPVGIRPLQPADWAAIRALDLPAFGADRVALLQSLAEGLPRAAWVAVAGPTALNPLSGYVLARRGRVATQIGPLVAADESTARALLSQVLQALPGPWIVDLPVQHAAWQDWLQQLGFVGQRNFLRMLRNSPGPTANWRHAPGDPRQIYLVGGPELG